MKFLITDYDFHDVELEYDEFNRRTTAQMRGIVSQAGIKVE